jgi:predicted MarR family transcription regulator
VTYDLNKESMKTNPSEVFLLQKIDKINLDNHGQGALLESVLDGIDKEHITFVSNTLKKLEKIGVLKVTSRSKQLYYKLTGSFEASSEEVRHYVKHRTIPD